MRNYSKRMNFSLLILVSIFLSLFSIQAKTKQLNPMDREVVQGLIQGSDDIYLLNQELIQLRKEVEENRKKYNFQYDLIQAKSSEDNLLLYAKAKGDNKKKGNSGQIDPEIIEGLIQQSEDISLMSEQISDLRKELKMQNELFQKGSYGGNGKPLFSWTQFGKSLLVPGWGHLSAESSWKAYVYGGLFLTSSYFAYTKYTDFKDKGNAYSDVGTPLALIFSNQLSLAYYYSGQSKSDLGKAELSANEALGAVAFIYLMSAIDAGFSSPKSDPNVGFKFNSQRETLALNQKNTILSADYTWSF